jgi:hypothetical protein
MSDKPVIHLRYSIHAFFSNPPEKTLNLDIAHERTGAQYD